MRVTKLCRKLCFVVGHCRQYKPSSPLSVPAQTNTSHANVELRCLLSESQPLAIQRQSTLGSFTIQSKKKNLHGCRFFLARKSFLSARPVWAFTSVAGVRTSTSETVGVEGKAQVVVALTRHLIWRFIFIPADNEGEATPWRSVGVY